MAIRDETMPAEVTVFCDECGETETHDYLVPAGVDSLAVARNWLSANKGWEITPHYDFCSMCAVEESADQ